MGMSISRDSSHVVRVNNSGLTNSINELLNYLILRFVYSKRSQIGFNIVSYFSEHLFKDMYAMMIQVLERYHSVYVFLNDVTQCTNWSQLFMLIIAAVS